jgi:hypothetical protein
MDSGGSPPALAQTGSKSTNQDLKIAPRHGLQGFVHAAIQFDFVVESAEDVGDGALITNFFWHHHFQLLNHHPRPPNSSTALCRKAAISSLPGSCTW